MFIKTLIFNILFVVFPSFYGTVNGNLVWSHGAEIRSESSIVRSEDRGLTKGQTILFVFSLMGMFVMGGLMTILIYRNKQIKALQEKTDLQLKVLRLQMNPHFIFNSLSSIQNLLINDDVELASGYLGKFSALVRSVLHSSFNDTVDINTEVKTIESYLALQRLRFSNRFDYFINVDPSLDDGFTEFPVMLLQPFLENAIEHGIKHLSTPGSITVSFKRSGQFMEVEIEDNGIGRKKAEELRLLYHKDHKPMATETITDRINHLNKRQKLKITLDVIDLKDEKGEACGTRVVLRIPL